MVPVWNRVLTSLDLHNFRAFEAQHVELAPITVFVGPNNSGKSSVLSAIRILAQTFRSPDWNVPLLLGEFGTFRDVVYGNVSTRVIGLGFGLRSLRGKCTVAASFEYRAQRREIILRDLTIRDSRGKVLFQSTYLREGERQVIKSIAGATPGSSPWIMRKPARLVHFLPRVLNVVWDIERHKRQVPYSVMRQLHLIDDLSRDAGRLLQSVQYIGAFREMPLRLYPFSGERPSGLGPTGSGATDMLVADYFRRGTRKQELSSRVRDWLSSAEISDELEIRALGDRHYEVRLRHPKTHELENLRDVGFGISQVLPVLVGAYSAEQNSLFIVEEPEIHLHPRAQAALGDLFLDLYRRKIQCIVETHSEHLIMRLQRHVASGDIPPHDLGVNYVTATAQRKKIVRLPLNEDGIFGKKWPEGFFEERMEEALELARAPLKRRRSVASVG